MPNKKLIVYLQLHLEIFVFVRYQNMHHMISPSSPREKLYKTFLNLKNQSSLLRQRWQPPRKESSILIAFMMQTWKMFGENREQPG